MWPSGGSGSGASGSWSVHRDAHAEALPWRHVRRSEGGSVGYADLVSWCSDNPSLQSRFLAQAPNGALISGWASGSLPVSRNLLEAVMAAITVPELTRCTRKWLKLMLIGGYILVHLTLNLSKPCLLDSFGVFPHFFLIQSNLSRWQVSAKLGALGDSEDSPPRWSVLSTYPFLSSKSLTGSFPLSP